MMDTRTFVNAIQKKIPFLPIIPEVHNMLDPRTFLIFLFTFIECKHNFKHFFRLYSKIRQAKHPQRFLCTQPRSGTRYIMNLCKSALELSKGKSGKPSFNAETHTWDYESDLSGYAADLRNLVYDFRLRKLHPCAISFVHHPIQKADLVDMKTVRPVFTLRHPVDDCKAWYHHRDAKTPEERYAPEKIGLEKWRFISRRIERIIYHFNYWGEYIKNKQNGKDYLCIKYEELMKNTAEILKGLFKFWEIEVNENVLEKAAELNSYENTMKYVQEQGVSETKVITLRKKTDFNEDVLALIKEKLDKELIHDFGYKY